MKKFKTFRAVGLSLILLASFTFTQGCKSVNPGGGHGMAPADAEVIAYSAASVGAGLYLAENTNARPAFEAAWAALGTLSGNPRVTQADLVAVLQSLPVKELKGDKGAIIMTGIVTVQGLVANRVSVTNEYVVAVVRGLFEGLGAALGKPRAALNPDEFPMMNLGLGLAGAATIALRVELFRDRKKEHRARLIASNGNVLFVSAEGYKRRRSPQNAVKRLEEAFKSGRTKITIC